MALLPSWRPTGFFPTSGPASAVVGHRMPLAQFGVRVDDLRVLHQPVAEVVDDGGDGEDAAETFIKSRFCHDCVLLWVCLRAMHQGRSRDGPVAPVESLAGTLVCGPGPPPGTAAPRRARPPTTCQVDAHDPVAGGRDRIAWPCPRWVAVDEPPRMRHGPGLHMSMWARRPGSFLPACCRPPSRKVSLDSPVRMSGATLRSPRQQPIPLHPSVGKDAACRPP